MNFHDKQMSNELQITHCIKIHTQVDLVLRLVPPVDVTQSQKD